MACVLFDFALFYVYADKMFFCMFLFVIFFCKKGGNVPCCVENGENVR